MKESGIGTVIQNSNIQAKISAWMFYVMILLCVSIPLSEFGMSASQFLLLGLWVYEGANFNQSSSRNGILRHLSIITSNLKRKFRKALRNPALIALVSIYLLHFIGLIYTQDLANGMKDLRIKLPLLSLPIIIATSESLNKKRFGILMIFFCLAVFAGSGASMYALFTRKISDSRDLSLFISHIRFSLQICLAIFTLLIFAWKRYHSNKWANISFVLLAFWLIYFLFILKSMTGIVILGIVFIILGFIWIFKHKALVIPSIVLIIILLTGGWLYIRDVYKGITIAERVDFDTLDKFTALGNPYQHDTISFGIENGKHVGLYLSVPELRNAWNSRSHIEYFSADDKGQSIRFTLIRYLHSKGLRKDAEGVNKLTSKDISLIENGVANSQLLGRVNIKGRIEQALQGYSSYMKNGNPNASSMMQRFEYWKTSIYLIEKQPLFGYGTGDLNIAFEKGYSETNTSLLPEFRHRSHNQFLAITIALGALGFIVFMVSLFFPPIRIGKFSNILYLVFFLISFFSFLTEDTLETQAGVTFFSFFSAVLIFGVRGEVDHILKYGIFRKSKSKEA
jgi:hypothetical protein